ncbi:MAG: AraC family transcriptional regulator [Blautia sp.]|nr:AraC family transcriptional regulator [Blautia sp.]
MAELLTQAEKNLDFLQKILPLDETVYLWAYTDQGELVTSTCPEENILDTAFTLFGSKRQAMEHFAEDTAPMLLGSPIGLQWAAALEKERKEPCLIFVIGPVFYQHISANAIKSAMLQYHGPEMNLALKHRLTDVLPQVPVMPLAVFGRYALLLHNAVTGEQRGLADLAAAHLPPLSQAESVPCDRHKIYHAEQALLQMVRDGDINYHGALQTSISMSGGVPVAGKDPLRQPKTSVVVFTSLVVRAAMEGGLSPEEAYPLGDAYIQTVESCTDSGELDALARAMYDDFIHRVHRCRANPDYSLAVQKCCDYLELNLDKKISVEELAALTGYSDYYLTTKFKKETGFSIAEYRKVIKVQRARTLLLYTDKSVQQIAGELAFNTPNYFIQSFREVEGCTPAQYRKKSQK